ncbi:MAG TPA: hypothetical protein VEI97_14675 [bacterium]|nr:hypothetical protein [bacterium]
MAEVLQIPLEAYDPERLARSFAALHGDLVQGVSRSVKAASEAGARVVVESQTRAARAAARVHSRAASEVAAGIQGIGKAAEKMATEYVREQTAAARAARMAYLASERDALAASKLAEKQRAQAAKAAERQAAEVARTLASRVKAAEREEIKRVRMARQAADDVAKAFVAGKRQEAAALKERIREEAAAARAARSAYLTSISTADRLRVKQQEVNTAYRQGLLTLEQYGRASRSVHARIARAEGRGGLVGVLDGLATNLQKLPGTAGVAGGALSSLTASVTALGTPMTAVAASVAVAGAGLFKLATGAAASINAVRQAALASGFNATELSRLQVVAARTGFQLIELADANLNLAEKMKNSPQVIQDLGIRVREVTDGSLRPVSAVFLEVADHISTMSNETEQLAAAGALFGEDTAKKLLPALRSMPGAFAASAAEADRLNLTMSSERLAQAQAYQRAITDLGLALEGLKLSTVGLLGPLTTFAESINPSRKKGGAESLLSTLASVHPVLGTLSAAWGYVSVEAGKADTAMRKAVEGIPALLEDLDSRPQGTGSLLFRDKGWEKKLEEEKRKGQEAFRELEKSVREYEETVSDKLQRAEEEFGDLGRSIQVPAMQLTDAFLGVNDVVGAAEEAFAKAAERAAKLGAAIADVGSIAGSVGAGGLSSVIGAFGGLVDALNSPGASKLSQISAAFSLGAVAAKAIGAVLDRLTQSLVGSSLMEILSGEGPARALDRVVAGLPRLLNDIQAKLPGFFEKLSGTVIPAIGNILGQAVRFALRNWDVILAGLLQALGAIVGTLIVEIGRGIRRAAQNFWRDMRHGADGLGARLLAFVPDFFEVVVRGLVGGLAELLARIFDAIGMDKIAERLHGFATAMTAGADNQDNSTASTGEAAGGGSGAGGRGTARNAAHPVSDAFLPPGPARTVQTTRGDAVLAYQGGGPNDLPSLLREVIQAVRENTDEVRAGNEAMRRALQPAGLRTNMTPVPRLR